MKRGQAWLSEGAERLASDCEVWRATPPSRLAQARPPTFDVVVVGSGYGGAVAAQRLSELAEPADGGPPKPMSVCVLERGQEYTPGSFPDRFTDLVGHLRVHAGGMPGAPANPLGLMDWRLGGDVAALVANGLGGGSLINAGVCEPASAEALGRQAWPEPWRGNRPLWDRLYERASDRLGAQPWSGHSTNKQAAMAELAARLGGGCRPVVLSIVPPAGAAAAPADPARPAKGFAQLPDTRPCIECGDCFTGCNVGAKRTLGHNYLAQARRQGAQLFTGATVHSVVAVPAPAAAPDDDPEAAAGKASEAPAQAPPPRWIVRWRLTDPERLPGGTQLFEVHARHVVLAAGTYGSTEILMRSRDAGLAVSGRLGDGFSANGDLLSAWYDLGREVGISPDENLALAQRQAGPTITSQIEWETRPRPDDQGQPSTRHVVQDLTVPGALAWLFGEALTTMMVPQRWTRPNWSRLQPTDPDLAAVDPAAIGRSLLTVAYVDDGAGGRLEPAATWATALRDGDLVVRWPGLGQVPGFAAMDRHLAISTPTSAYLRSPLWQFMPKADYLGLGQGERRLLTVHPLGGCRMGENARDGVVNPWGAVFNTGLGVADDGNPASEVRRNRLAGEHDRTVHAGLYVLDGAIVPGALGINPLLTITALAEGAIDQWQADLGWQPCAAVPRPLPPLPLPPPPPDQRDTPPATAIAFSERMHGDLPQRPGQPDDLNHRLSMKVDFEPVGDLQAFLRQPQKALRLHARFHVDAETRAQQGVADRDQGEPVGPPLVLHGRVRWLEMEPSCVGQRLWRTGTTYLRTRWKADRAEARHRGRGFFEGAGEKLVGATHFGAVRILDYAFDPLPADWILVPKQGSDDGLKLPKGTVLKGRKRLGYRLQAWRDPESANPWLQLTELPLQAREEGGHIHPLGTLRFDPLAAVDRYDLPLKVIAQDNAVAAMRDTLSLALYFGRVLFSLHMFSFRRAEYPAEVWGPRGLRRLPPAGYTGRPDYAHLQVQTFIVPQRPGKALAGEPPLPLRLTHVHRPAYPRPEADRRPVLLIHGFGSGGVQFTHPDIPQPMAAWLADRGHDVWVADLRTSIGLPSSRLQWSLDEVALHDIPTLAQRVCQETGAPQLDVVAHCIGSAMFCMAMLAGRMHHEGHPDQPLVRRAVLMQVGPRVVLPRVSRARAYVAVRLRQLFATAEAQSVASQDVGDLESFTDRLIGSYLYPKDERQHYRLTGDVHENAGRTNANRSAAIFGQLFQKENMSHELLRALDELLGHCNLTTYEQTAQYAFERSLTNQAGEDAYVTDAALRAHFNIPLLLVHGQENRTFHPETLDQNEALFKAFNPHVTALRVEHFGHLDCVVGTTADAEVFTHIDKHLASQPAPAVPAANLPGPTLPGPKLRLPRVGPWLGHAEFDPAQQCIRLRLGLRLDHLGRGLLGVASLWCDGNTALGTVQQHPNPPPPPPPPPQPPLPGEHKPPPAPHERFIEVMLPMDLAQGAGELTLLVGAAHHGWPASPQQMQQAAAERSAVMQRTATRLGRPLQALPGLQIDRAWLQRLIDPAPQDLHLVLGACRQRPLLVDRVLADASMRHIAWELGADPEGIAGQPPPRRPVDAVVLCGDQVYADSMANAGNTGATEGRFLDSHHEAWSAKGQRDVLRRRPVYMVVDDHEFRNDYNQVIARGRPDEFGFAKAAWQRYQQAAGPDAPRGRPEAPWRTTTLRGVPVFLCDTRSERFDPARLDRRGARIMSPQQMTDLKDWLLKQQCGDAPGAVRNKLVVTGTPVAPWFRPAQGPDGANTWGDGWQRFPDSVAALLGHIAEHEIEGVVFLAGDYHLAADAHLTLTGLHGRSVAARSIVTGGLYSPFPFANASPDEWLAGADAQRLPAGGASWGYTLRVHPPGHGYTRLAVPRVGEVQAEFIRVHHDVAGIHAAATVAAPWPPP